MQLPEDAPAVVAEALQKGIFGPLNAHLPAKLEEDEDVDAEGDDVEEEVSRKRAPDQQTNESPANKRPRLSNGYENGTDAAATVTTPMDLDQQTDNHAYPSPYDGEQVPEPPVRTDGPEQGTQVDKVEELAPVTTFIRLSDDEHAQTQTQGSETTPSSPSPANPENAPILLQCEWSPRDPSVLAAAGTDALARIWTIARAPQSEAGQDPVPPESHSLLEPDTPRDTTVTALSWTSDGTSLAIATDSKNQAAISVWTADGTHLQTIEITEPPIVKLSWNPGNAAFLAISPSKGGAAVTVYYSPSGNSLSYFLTGHDIFTTPLDATWISDAEFLLCGGDLLLCLRCTETSITQVRKFETKEEDSFTQVLFDWRSKLAATSSDKGILHVRNSP